MFSLPRTYKSVEYVDLPTSAIWGFMCCLFRGMRQLDTKGKPGKLPHWSSGFGIGARKKSALHHRDMLLFFSGVK